MLPLTFLNLGITQCILSPSAASILSSSEKPRPHPNSHWAPTSKPISPVISPTPLCCGSGSCLFVSMVSIFVYPTVLFFHLGFCNNLMSFLFVLLPIYVSLISQNSEYTIKVLVWKQK